MATEDEIRERWLDEPLTITLPRRTWLVVHNAAQDFDARVPPEQGDGGDCLRVIKEAIDR